jgi:hypothetical protein
VEFPIRNRGWNYAMGAFFFSVGAFVFLSDRPHSGYVPWICIITGLARLTDAATPCARLNRERLIVGAGPFRTTILLKDIVRLESDPILYFANRNIVVHESSGRKTAVSRLDTNKFIGALSDLLPETVNGRSTGIAPPPYSGTTSLPATTGAAPFNFNLISWMSLVYDSRTHTIRKPSEQ